MRHVCLMLFALFTCSCSTLAEGNGQPLTAHLVLEAQSHRPYGSVMPNFRMIVSHHQATTTRFCATNWYRRSCSESIQINGLRQGDEIAIQVNDFGCLPTIDIEPMGAHWNCTFVDETISMQLGHATFTSKSNDDDVVSVDIENRANP